MLQLVKERLESAIKGDDELTIRTELVGGVGKIILFLVGYILEMRKHR